MNPRVLALAASISFALAPFSSCLADEANPLFQKYSQAADQAFQQQQFRKAETNLLRAIKVIEAQEDVTLARVLTRLASTYRQEGKTSDAASSLGRALKIYQKLGYVETDFVNESGELAKEVKLADLERLGRPSASALKENNAVITMNKSGDGSVNVTIDMPLRMEKPLNSPKLDGIALEKLVTFNILKQPDGRLHLSNIKGFKIHSVEKDMWVNLLDLSIGGTDPDGKYETQLTAGKAGITKTVDAKLPASAFEPIGGIAAQMDSFGAPIQFALPVVTSVKQSPATETATSTNSGTPATTAPATPESTLTTATGSNDNSITANTTGSNADSTSKSRVNSKSRKRSQDRETPRNSQPSDNPPSIDTNAATNSNTIIDGNADTSASTSPSASTSSSTSPSPSSSASTSSSTSTSPSSSTPASDANTSSTVTTSTESKRAGKHHDRDSDKDKDKDDDDDDDDDKDDKKDKD